MAANENESPFYRRIRDGSMSNEELLVWWGSDVKAAAMESEFFPDYFDGLRKGRSYIAVRTALIARGLKTEEQLTTVEKILNAHEGFRE